MVLNSSPGAHINGSLEISKFRAYKKKPLGAMSPTPDARASGSMGAVDELRSPDRSDMGVQLLSDANAHLLDRIGSLTKEAQQKEEQLIHTRLDIDKYKDTGDEHRQFAEKMRRENEELRKSLRQHDIEVGVPSQIIQKEREELQKRREARRPDEVKCLLQRAAHLEEQLAEEKGQKEKLQTAVKDRGLDIDALTEKCDRLNAEHKEFAAQDLDCRVSTLSGQVNHLRDEEARLTEKFKASRERGLHFENLAGDLQARLCELEATEARMMSEKGGAMHSVKNMRKKEREAMNDAKELERQCMALMIRVTTSWTCGLVQVSITHPSRNDDGFFYAFVTMAPKGLDIYAEADDANPIFEMTCDCEVHCDVVSQRIILCRGQENVILQCVNSAEYLKWSQPTDNWYRPSPPMTPSTGRVSSAMIHRHAQQLPPSNVPRLAMPGNNYGDRSFESFDSPGVSISQRGINPNYKPGPWDDAAKPQQFVPPEANNVGDVPKEPQYSYGPAELAPATLHSNWQQPYNTNNGLI